VPRSDEAAARCTAPDAATLRAIIEHQRAAPSDKAFFAADEAMHRALMVLAGQEAAWQVVDAAKVNLDRIRHLSARHTFKRLSILAEHERIIDAVIAGDRDGAVAAMRQHLRGVFTSSGQMMRMHPEFFHATTGDPRPHAANVRTPKGEPRRTSPLNQSPRQLPNQKTRGKKRWTEREDRAIKKAAWRLLPC